MTKLTDKQIELLIKIADETKISCWFSIKQGRSGKLYIYDLEEHKKMSLKNGVKLLFEGLSNIDFMTIEEQETFEALKKEI